MLPTDDLPSSATSQAESAIELVRVCLTDNLPQVTVRAVPWKDPAAAWAVVLVDLATQVATTYEREAGIDRTATLCRMRDALDAEIRVATPRTVRRHVG